MECRTRMRTLAASAVPVVAASPLLLPVVSLRSGIYQGNLLHRSGRSYPDPTWRAVTTACSLQPHRFEGRQWYFRCPATQHRCSVLWMPLGATRFCSRQAWRKQVAYASQFESASDRASRGQATIKSRLIGNCDPDDWELPPKPRWMRWGTYNRHVQRFESYDSIIDVRLECWPA
jgi:hypothetical protein